MIRLTGGSLRGRCLKVPAGIRPTTGWTRKAAFDLVGDAVRGARVLDAAAGSGAYGIEALSRGAVEATFVEREPREPRAGGRFHGRRRGGGGLAAGRRAGRTLVRPRLLRPAVCRGGRRRAHRPPRPRGPGRDPGPRTRRPGREPRGRRAAREETAVRGGLAARLPALTPRPARTYTQRFDRLAS
ncbi:hypothetical protein FBQ97_21840 [Acidobacteria bacterium ACD]|nr:hypothetical protein [Acidobacteria bacterium ACD]